MDNKSIEEEIIKKYQQDEKMMVLVFAQWCVNNDLNPVSLYEKAHPSQKDNTLLTEAIHLTVSKEEAGLISDDTLLGVLSLYGNDELAFVVSKEMVKKR
ncbi:hypothetical protein ACERII_06865 [Evansella sp. AB-rgal1]|uniref:hypothetical protein n=1 Tax=Evansella sp. AB-rgal1 TaxID=3242696 RepID=UPI00359E9874